MRRWLFLAVSIAVSVFFLYIGLQGMNLAEVWNQITHANFWWLIPGVLVYFLAVWGRTWRWHYLLRPLKEVPLRKLFPIVVIGYMGNNVYPFRAGEVIRAYVLRRNEGVKITASLATIIVELIFDGFVMLMTAVVNLATTLPGAPGYIGTFDGPGIKVLEAFNVNHEVAAGYTLVLHAALWLPITLLGFFYLAQQGLSWGSFSEATEVVNSEKHNSAENLPDSILKVEGEAMPS